MMDKATVLTFVLDESGSMESIKSDTLGGFNSYISGLQADPKPLEFTLIKFDSNHVTKVYVGVPLSDVQPLTDATYTPGAMTPLIDASYKAIKATEDVVAKRSDDPYVLIVIQTDGYENASTEYTRVDLAQLVKEKTAAGWGFVFLGAGIDAFGQASQLGFTAANTMSYARTRSAQTFSILHANTIQYRAGGGVQSLGFTPEQRASSGDEDGGDDITPSTPSIPPTSKSQQRRVETQRRAPIVVDDFDLTRKP